VSGILYLIPTPIGNLGDITYRAVETLKSVDYILAEDTRTSKVLLNHYHIDTPCHSFHQHNEHHKLNGIINDIKNGKSVAQISDAGTPGVSDPGFLLARACLQNQLTVDVLPGATAFIPALLKSGFALHKFTFEGFLPMKKGRQTKLIEIANADHTTVFYESPHKLLKTLEQLSEIIDPQERRISVSRELTKKFEETITGSLADVLAHFKTHAPKGEFVVTLEGVNS
jgi:16S rRNA (cytidine1402-2'-O)-methyltransferase